MVQRATGIQSAENPFIRREYKTEGMIIVKSFLKKNRVILWDIWVMKAENQSVCPLIIPLCRRQCALFC